jgi:hypothetical protein
MITLEPLQRVDNNGSNSIGGSTFIAKIKLAMASDCH